MHPTARVLNTVSTVLGIVWGIWVPAVLIWALAQFFAYYQQMLNCLSKGDSWNAITHNCTLIDY